KSFACEFDKHSIVAKPFLQGTAVKWACAPALGHGFRSHRCLCSFTAPKSSLRGQFEGVELPVGRAEVPVQRQRLVPPAGKHSDIAFVCPRGRRTESRGVSIVIEFTQGLMRPGYGDSNAAAAPCAPGA